MTGPCHSMRLKTISTLLARDVLNARELLNTFDMSTSHNWHWQRKKQVTQLQLLLFKICKRWKAFAACFGTSCTWNRSWKGARHHYPSYYHALVMIRFKNLLNDWTWNGKYSRITRSNIIRQNRLAANFLMQNLYRPLVITEKAQPLMRS